MEEYRRGLLERTAEALDLPGDVLAGLPHIELTGNRELRMENHKEILSYGGEESRTSGGKLEITGRGRGLELRAMNAGQLFITGTIQGVELC